MTEPVAVKLSKSVPSGATAVAVPVFADRLNKVEGVRKAALDRARFGGKPGESLVLDDGQRARVLVGMGPFAEAGAVELRRAAAVFGRQIGRHRRAGFEYPVDLGLDAAEGVKAVTEGLLLGTYRFDAHRPKASEEPRTEAVTIAGEGLGRALQEAVERGRAVAGAVCFARDLVNEPGGTLTPTEFAQRAAERATEAGLQVEVLDEEAIAEARLGGLLAVNKGSAEPPRLVKLTYEPDAPTGEVALVGKGITFDSGGLSLKPADSMMEMKSDMAGAAAVIAAMCALPALGVTTRVVAFTPMTDNMVGGSAQRPGDVYTARNGKTVEVLNTDAEGRLILADALALAAEEEPDAIVDLATLTGACMIALGTKIAGLMGNDEEFVGRVERAAGAAGERVWHLPLPADYRAQLDSTIADLRNIATGRYGGTLTAGLFLGEFVPDGTPWAHLDIAGPAFSSDGDAETPKGGTGFGVRTLLELLTSWGEEGSDEEPAEEG